MTVKYKDTEFAIKDVNTAEFRRDSYFLVADLYNSVNKFPDNFLKAYYDFFFPSVVVEKDGIKTFEIVTRFREIFETFLEGDLSKIGYEMDRENTDELIKLGREIISFFSLKTEN